MRNKENKDKRGQIFSITGPSGSGKTTIINSVRKDLDQVGYSISHTTRTPRKGEVDGVDYYFIDRFHFQKMIEAREFVEWAVVYGQFYGTSLSSVQKILASGNDLIIDVDVQGAKSIKGIFPESISIFILPPAVEVLRERLEKRSLDKKETIDLRITQAYQEIQNCRNYDYIVVNDDLGSAVREVEAIITAQRAKSERRLHFIKNEFFN